MYARGAHIAICKHTFVTLSLIISCVMCVSTVQENVENKTRMVRNNFECILQSHYCYIFVFSNYVRSMITIHYKSQFLVTIEMSNVLRLFSMTQI
jgi:hypothetical protein